LSVNLNYGGEAQVQKIIDDALDNFLSKPRGNHDRIVGTYWINEIPWCMKKTWFKFKVNRQTPPKLLRKFKTGDIFQAFLETVIKDYRSDMILLENERSMTLCPWTIDDEIKINGRLDDLVILKWPGSDERTIFEVKATGRIPNEVREEYAMQIMPYLRVMGVPRGFIVYGHPNTLDIKVFEVKYDKAIMQKVLDRARKIDHFVRTDTLPDEGPNYDWECSDCLYKDLCWPKWKKDNFMSNGSITDVIKSINGSTASNDYNNNNNISAE